MKYGLPTLLIFILTEALYFLTDAPRGWFIFLSIVWGGCAIALFFYVDLTNKYNPWKRKTPHEKRHKSKKSTKGEL